MNTTFKQSVDAVLKYCEKNDFSGYGKFDALNSPILKALTFNNKWLRILYSQAIKLSPINIRPFIFVKKYRNPKGIALFIRAYISLYKITQDNRYKDLAIELSNWLLSNSSRGYSGACWGYFWDWQDLGFYAPFDMPNCVVTAFVGQALVDSYELTGDDVYLDTARSAIDFMLNDLKVLHESKDMKCISYAPVEMSMAVMDVSALAGALMARVAQHSKESMLIKEAKRLVNFVVDKQTDYNAWYYTYPPEDSPVKHDNYHTGFILNAILDYSQATGDDSYQEQYSRGLEFYRDNLFLTNGAPKWRSDKEYPYDIHGAATGIETFSRAALHLDSNYLNQANKIAKWTIEHMQHPDGYFYYQIGKRWSKKYTLMRWCNAWMAQGLTSLLVASNRLES